MYLDIYGKIYVFRSPEVYIRHYRGITTYMGKLPKSLEEIGYQRNNYDWYVMKKTVMGKKCTILWHVENLNMSHVDSDIVSSVLTDTDA